MVTAARLLPLILFLTAVAVGCSAWEMNIRLPTERLAYGGGEAVVAPIIHALRPLLGSGRQLAARAGVACDSWRLGVEAHNVIDWRTVPAECEGYIGHYMLGEHYRRDFAVVVDEAVAYAETLKLAGNGKEIWVFDIDETSLSNLPYYAKHGFGYVYVYSYIIYTYFYQYIHFIFIGAPADLAIYSLRFMPFHVIRYFDFWSKSNSLKFD
ncbi:hypothetical protein DAI22_05g180900 [Oryza sativa Japonica Group]|uniref:Acid phosphatase n=3 Tax=Oryza sativa subsp. japonica TaxID=39947 RepID=B7ECK1_ORYSJ|nr:putative acid phosphatase [Oryza sativa Japonica Group]KAF2929509.1 hypothetical protein DAI22_05g180900 [Oryza sativa Japonica Group]BAG90098.1 unnamed protein product [Oryza sativa Japonica Group]